MSAELVAKWSDQASQNEFSDSLGGGIIILGLVQSFLLTSK